MKKVFRFLIVGLLGFTLAGCKLFDFNWGNNNDDPVNRKENEDPVDPVDPVDPGKPTDKSICETDPQVCNVTISTETMPYDATDDQIVAVYEQAVKSTVTILAYTDTYKFLSSGSGVIYSTSSDEQYVYIYTNAHVVNVKTNAVVNGEHTTVKASVFEVIYYNNIRVLGTVVAENGSEDVAVIKAEIEPNKDYGVATIGDSTKLKIGQAVLTIGTPLNTSFRNTLTKGVVSGLNVPLKADNDEDGVDTEMFLIQIDAAISSGNSGGPLFSVDGKFIGINTMKKLSTNTQSVDSMNFSIPSNHVVKVTDTLMQAGSYRRPRVGLHIVDLGDQTLRYKESKGITVALGMYVSSETDASGVVAGGACDGRIEDHEVIIKFNDVDMVNKASFIVELIKHSIGDTVEFTVCNIDGTNVHTVEIVLG